MLLQPGCGAGEPALPTLTEFQAAWGRDQHAVWEVDWPAAPLPGPVVVEAWQSGARRRFEVLEAAAPALIGETLVSDGQTGWLFNRFETDLTAVEAAEARFSPLDDALALVTRQLGRDPRRVTPLGRATLPSGLARGWQLAFDSGATLDLWLLEQEGLVGQVRLTGPQASFRLRARQVEPLDDAPAGLFEGPR